jgi:Zn-dependent M28 family amino/carboxypeptidase
MSDAGLRCVWRAALLLPLAGCGGVDDAGFADAETEAAAATIDAELMRTIVTEISSDRYDGRGPGTEGDRMTREYLAQMLEQIGFEPGAVGGRWDQPFALVGVDARQPPTWTFTSDAGDVALNQGDEYIASSGLQAERAVLADSELVFVGYGIEAPEYQWDDFKGVDLTGKTLVMLNNDPDWDPELFAGNERLYYGRWSYKYESAARQGAAGAIIIHTTPSAGYPWQVVRTSWTGEQFSLPAGDEPKIQVAGWVTEDAARKLLEGAGHDLDTLVESAKRRDFRPVELGLTTSLTLENTVTRTQSANVIGVLHGSDPELANEFVIYTAHHDHLGTIVGGSTGDDTIYNGARDNASGVGMVMSIGRALAALETPPRRSIMLLFVGAEEQGLLGAKYFAAYPTVAPGRIAANINYDSGNIWGATSDITFIGLGKSSLDAIAESVADYQGRELKPDQFPDEGSYYRSDQFAFASIGVPAFYFRNGTEFVGRPEGWGETQIRAYTDTDYHQPSDEYSQSWSFDGMVQDARFGFWAGLLVANADTLPSWNPGNEFEATRKAALAELERLDAR